MKKLLFFSLFISFKMFGQTPKMEVIATTSETTSGIRSILKNTSPSLSYSAIIGLNNSTNSNGFGVTGEHAGSGIGVYGRSSGGTGVYGFSQFGTGTSGVYGLAYGAGSNGVRGYSENGYGNGVYGSAESGIGVYGHALNFFSTTGIGGYFSNASSTGYSLVTGIGKVGIGATPNLNVDERLDLNGRLRIRHEASTAGVWFNNSTNSISYTDGAFHGMLNDNNTGIFIGGAWRFWVNNTGQVTSTSLSGTGNRPVLVDANGTLIAEPSAQTLILQPTEFQPLVWSSSLYRFETSISFTTIGGLVAPIKLPVGAKINSITMRAKDNLNTGRILYSLEKMNTTTNVPSQLSTGSSTIAEANTSAINYVFTNSLPVTIQASNYYYITVNVYDSNSQITVPWNSGTNYFLGWIEIQYTF